MPTHLRKRGKTPLYFSTDGRFAGMIAVADVIKPDSPGAVRDLEKMGIRVVMLTGDNERTARAIAKQAGVGEVIAGRASRRQGGGCAGVASRGQGRHGR